MVKTTTLTITITVSVMWWVKYYISALSLFCTLFGTYPDPDKLERILSRGIRIGYEK